MIWENIYEYGISPLTEAKSLKDGKLYVVTSGEVVRYNKNGEFDLVNESPLAVIEGEENTVENLTEQQLSLYWALCRNAKTMEENG